MALVMQVRSRHTNEVMVGHFVEQKEAMVRDHVDVLDTDAGQLAYRSGTLLDILLTRPRGQTQESTMAGLVQGGRIVE